MDQEQNRLSTARSRHASWFRQTFGATLQAYWTERGLDIERFAAELVPTPSARGIGERVVYHHGDRAERRVEELCWNQWLTPD